MTGGPADEKYFFIHVMKTGGTVVTVALRRLFGANNVYPSPADAATPLAQVDTRVLTRAWPDRRATASVIAGHFPYCAGHSVEPGARTFTVLRDPVERMLSLLRSQRMHEPEPTRRTLEEIYLESVAINPIASNHMVRVFGMHEDEMTVGLLSDITPTKEHLERAKKNLASVDVIGVQHDLPAFAKALGDAFGWDVGTFGVGNVSAPAPAPTSLLDRIRRDEHLDARLWEHATMLVAARAGS